MASAALATLVGVLLLSSGLGTWSGWRQSATQDLAGLAAGSVELSGSLKIELLSQQPIGSRVFSSSETCAAPSPYVECRIVTASLPSERLIPGDTLRVTRLLALGGAGDNLRGELEIDASGLVNRVAGQLSSVAVVSGTITEPDGSQVAGVTHRFSVDRGTTGAASGFGTYTATFLVSLPATDNGARWDERLQGHSLDLGDIRASFHQTN